MTTSSQANSRLRTEMEARLRRVTNLMRSRGLKGLLIYSDAGNAANVRYLTNYQPLFGVVILVLRQDGASVLINTFNWDAPRARLQSGLDTILSGFCTGELVVQALKALGISDESRIGLVGSALIPHNLFAAVFDLDKGPSPVDVSLDYEKPRLLKSPLELELLRQAISITDDAIMATISEIGTGMSEQQVAALLEFQMKKRGAEGFAFPSAVASGLHTEKPVSLPADRKLQSGDLLMIDAGATFEGYSADVTRMFVVGKPTEQQQRVHRVVEEALEVATRAVHPGIPASDLHRAAVASLATHDLDQYFTHRVGHGIGLETSLEAPDLQRDDTVLEPGMTFCLEPGVYIPGFGGIKIEDDLVVTADGVEVLSTGTRELVRI